MGSLNAQGHVLVAMSGGVPALWDLLGELCARAGYDPPTIHGHTPDERVRGMSRYCLHPKSIIAEELKGDDLADLLTMACLHVSRDLPEHDLWRRD